MHLGRRVRKSYLAAFLDEKDRCLQAAGRRRWARSDLNDDLHLDLKTDREQIRSKGTAASEDAAGTHRPCMRNVIS
jgi:hypothetical protein